MLNEAQLRTTVNRRTAVVLPALSVAVISVFAYLIFVGHFRDSWIELVDRTFGENAAEFAPIVMILPVFAIFLTPCVLAEKYNKRYSFICPSCSADITPSTQQVIATRCCSACGERVVSGGRKRDIAVYKRLRQLQFRSFLKYWFWAWPTVAAACLVQNWFDPMALQRCPHLLFFPALIGTVAAGWTWIRTYDCRYIAQFFTSAVLFVFGCVAFWQAF
jgi:hypothetical protein